MQPMAWYTFAAGRVIVRHPYNFLKGRVVDLEGYFPSKWTMRTMGRTISLHHLENHFSQKKATERHKSQQPFGLINKDRPQKTPMISHHYIPNIPISGMGGSWVPWVPWVNVKAVENVNNLIAPKLTGMDVRDQKKIDDVMVQVALPGAAWGESWGDSEMLRFGSRIKWGGSLWKATVL